MSWDSGDGWCHECGDFFHCDDVGGYNPPCPCCGLCRACCESNPKRVNPDDDWYPEDDIPSRAPEEQE